MIKKYLAINFGIFVMVIAVISIVMMGDHYYFYRSNLPVLRTVSNHLPPENKQPTAQLAANVISPVLAKTTVVPTSIPTTPALPLPTSNTVSMVNSVDRCHYQGQSFVAGDVVKTNQHWIRCTPTIIFSSEQSTTEQVSSPAWTILQG